MSFFFFHFFSQCHHLMFCLPSLFLFWEPLEEGIVGRVHAPGWKLYLWLSIERVNWLGLYFPSAPTWATGELLMVHTDPGQTTASWGCVVCLCVSSCGSAPLLLPSSSVCCCCGWDLALCTPYPGPFPVECPWPSLRSWVWLLPASLITVTALGALPCVLCGFEFQESPRFVKDECLSQFGLLWPKYHTFVT